MKEHLPKVANSNSTTLSNSSDKVRPLGQPHDIISLTSTIPTTNVHPNLLGRFVQVHTEHHLDCPACTAQRQEMATTISGSMTFAEASAVWLKLRQAAPMQGKITARYIRHTTEVSYTQYVGSLNLFLGGMRLEDIDIGNIRCYQIARAAGDFPFIRARRPNTPPVPSPVKPKKVNQEISVLRRILETAGCWQAELSNFYRPLLEDEDQPQRALEMDEQELWLYTCQQKKRWEVVYWYSLLAMDCTLSTNEIQHFKLGDVSVFQRSVTVSTEGAKCKGRKRTIYIRTAEALWALEKLVERAREVCGCIDPQDYLLPFRLKGRGNGWDQRRPMTSSGIKREWQEVRVESHLLTFRQYDLRHTGHTNNALDGMTPVISAQRMGHKMNSPMQDRYLHIYESAQRRELDRLESLRKRPVREYVPKRYA